MVLCLVFLDSSVSGPLIFQKQLLQSRWLRLNVAASPALVLWLSLQKEAILPLST